MPHKHTLNGSVMVQHSGKQHRRFIAVRGQLCGLYRNLRVMEWCIYVIQKSSGNGMMLVHRHDVYRFPIEYRESKMVL